MGVQRSEVQILSPRPFKLLSVWELRRWLVASAVAVVVGMTLLMLSLPKPSPEEV